MLPSFLLQSLVFGQKYSEAFLTCVLEQGAICCLAVRIWCFVKNEQVEFVSCSETGTEQVSHCKVWCFV